MAGYAPLALSSPYEKRIIILTLNLHQPQKIFTCNTETTFDYSDTDDDDGDGDKDENNGRDVG